MSSLNINQKVWFITGCSSGFGRRLALIALARGDLVVATARSVDKLSDLPKSDSLHLLQLDVCGGPEILNAKLNEAVNVWGRIDFCVNNAGTGMKGLVEESGSQRYREQFQNNFFGLIDTTTAVLPHMRKQKSGTIVLMGSRTSWKNDLPGCNLYSTSKAAVRTFGETLAAEVAQFSIKVLIVEPGSFRTENIMSEPFYNGNITDYDTLRQKSESIYDTVPGNQPGDPMKAMEIVADVVRGEGVAAGKTTPLYLPLGRDSEDAIRDKARAMIDTLNEWQDVIRSTNMQQQQ